MRYRTVPAHVRLVGGFVTALIGLILVGVVKWLWFTSAGGSIDGTLVFIVLGLVLVGLGGFVALKRREYLDVDTAARQCTFVANGRPGWSVRLHEVGPLVITAVKIRMQPSENAPSTPWFRTEYRVIAAGAKGVAFHSAGSYPAARRFAARIAREWGVGLRGGDGKVINPNAIDQAMHQRLQSELSLRTPKPLPRDARVLIEESSELVHTC